MKLAASCHPERPQTRFGFTAIISSTCDVEGGVKSKQPVSAQQRGQSRATQSHAGGHFSYSLCNAEKDVKELGKSRFGNNRTALKVLPAGAATLHYATTKKKLIGY